jgi:DNA-binding MarR family transcriptional regulator
MTRQRATPEALEVMQTLWALDHALEARSIWMLRNLGVTSPQRLVLRIIGAAPGCSPGVAAGKLKLDPGTVSRLVSRLERLGLVQRAPDPADGRKHRLTLTRRGEALNAQIRGTVEAAVIEALEAATPQEVRLARKFIRGLTERLAVREAKS